MLYFCYYLSRLLPATWKFIMRFPHFPGFEALVSVSFVTTVNMSKSWAFPLQLNSLGDMKPKSRNTFGLETMLLVWARAVYVWPEPN